VTSTTLGYAFLGGLLPSFIWLYFLLKEDAAHPEPKKLLVFTFIAGMTAVLVALPLEQFMKAALTSNQTTLTLPVIVSWALIEEVLKYLMAVVFILWRNAVDEAPDYVIYMVTVALGFASAETMIFILNYSNGNPLLGSIIGNERFLGSALLHVVASAAIGFSLAFSFRSHPAVRMTAAAGGLILAIALHTVFNMLIISTGASALTALFLVWMVAVVFFAAFEVLKYFQYRN
jgi:RsiW-degrading membrane proteinase PrsW (M82 family)